MPAWCPRVEAVQITVDISAWPLMLWGPILRRVEANQVRVFVAYAFGAASRCVPAASLGSMRGLPLEALT